MNAAEIINKWRMANEAATTEYQFNCQRADGSSAHRFKDLEFEEVADSQALEQLALDAEAPEWNYEQDGDVMRAVWERDDPKPGVSYVMIEVELHDDTVLVVVHWNYEEADDEEHQG